VVQVWFAIALSCLGLIAGDIIMARDLTLEKFWRQQRNSEIPFARLRLPSFLPESATAPTMTSSRINFLIPRAYIEDDQDVIGQAHERHAAKRADQPAKHTRPTENSRP
jgi:hypothetical protein